MGRKLASAVGAFAARAALELARTAPGADRLERTNFRGHRVTLAGGPALAVGGTLAGTLAGPRSQAAAVAVAGLGSGAVGLYDDLVGGRPEHTAKGFKGHLRALREGRVTSGLVKIVGVGAAGLAAAALLPATEPQPVSEKRAGRKRSSRKRAQQFLQDEPGQPTRWRRRAVDVLLGAGVIAGAANLANLLDLRPGRALKAGILVGTPLARRNPAAAATVGAAASLLPRDLDEEIMLGDCGANALGALLGTAFVARAGTAGRLAALAGIVALTAASEKVSFTQVIERTPVLRELDAVGRKRVW